MKKIALFVCMIPVLLMGQTPQADLILFNGKIVTVDSRFSIAQAIAVRQGTLIVVGTNAAVQSAAGPNARRVDLRGHTVIPGLIDGHTHLFAMDTDVPMVNVKSVKDILQIASGEAAKKKPGEWIELAPPAEPPYHIHMLDQIAEHRLPNRWELDQAAPKNPVIIKSSQFHDDKRMTVLNSEGLKLFGITKETVPANVKVDRDKNGEPTGLVIGSAVADLNVNSVIRHSFTLDERLAELKKDFAEFHAGGVTTHYEGHGMPESTIDLYTELWKRGGMTMRSYLVKQINDRKSIREIEADLDAMKQFSGKGSGDDLFRVGGVAVVFGDNVGFGQGFMREPYIGPEGKAWNGLQLIPDDKFYAILRAAAARNFRVNIQASGGKAIDITVGALDRINKEIALAPLRPVIIHSQFPSEQNMKDAARIGIVPTTVTNFLWGQGNNYIKYYGRENANRAIPMRSWLEHNVPVVQSCDYGPHNGMFIIWQSIARKNGWTGETLGPQETLTREQALRVFTNNGARITFGEDKIGSLENGKFADLAVLDRDILTVPADQIKDIKVLATLVGGKEVYGSLTSIR
jgi:predicted amidohydrolase YtcJ